MKILLIFFSLSISIQVGLYGQTDSLAVKDFLIGLTFRSRLPDSIKPSVADLDYLSEYFSHPINYTEADKKYLQKVLNDTFPEKELMHQYKISTYYEKDITKEVIETLQHSDKDSLSIRDSIYQYYYKASSVDDLLYPIDIDLMLGLTNDTRFIPFLEERYADGYQKAAFALARMGVEPYLGKILKANVVDSMRRYGEAWFNKNGINYNPDLLPYICTEEALDLLIDNIMENDSLIRDHSLVPMDETKFDRNYEFVALRELEKLMKRVVDSGLQADYKLHIEKLKENLEREAKTLPDEEENSIIVGTVGLLFPQLINYEDLQKIRVFVAQNRDRLTNPANYRCPDYWKIEAGTEDFRTRYQRYR